MTLSNIVPVSKGGVTKFSSVHCKGLNSPIKHSKILHFLRHQGAQIIYLQETHVKSPDQIKLKRGWIGQIFSSPFST